MNEIINSFKYNDEQTFTREEVIKIVDSCFHQFASAFRKEAKEVANNIMDIIKGKN